MCGEGLVANSEYADQRRCCREEEAKRAARDIARLVERSLGYVEGHVDPVALRLFIQRQWGKLSALAHAVHNGR